jgi:hypothetical protein
MKKLALRVEALAVDSFAVEARARGGARGTVHGQAPCTWYNSCECPSARYHCGADPLTAYSCAFTQDEPCWTDAACPTRGIDC